MRLKYAGKWRQSLADNEDLAKAKSSVEGFADGPRKTVIVNVSNGLDPKNARWYQVEFCGDAVTVLVKPKYADLPKLQGKPFAAGEKAAA